MGNARNFLLAIKAQNITHDLQINLIKKFSKFEFVKLCSNFQ